VDYPGFNLRMARWANRKGIAVYYYISPQLWAWKENRVRIVKDHITRMYVIIPFEEVFYARHKIRVKYVGHPLAWRISEYRKTAVTRPGAKRLVLLPGSRKREILHMLPVMLKAARSLTDFEIHIAAAPAIPGALYYDLIRSSGIRGVTITFGNTYGLLQRATAAFCTSGTATLETALFDVPQVVCYKGDTLSYLIARRLIRVPYIAMVNLICGKTVVPELIQKDFTAPRLLRALDEILTPENLNTLRHDYAVLKDRLTSGNPADAVAQDLCQNLASVNG
jgi:lipid-A-disaccharide synthase